MLEAEGDGAADDLAEAEAEVPEGEARGLLRLCVPLAADDHEGGADGGLEDAEEDAGDEESLVAGSGSTAGRGDAPKGDIEAEPLCGGEPLEEVDLGEGQHWEGGRRRGRLTVGDLEAEEADKEKGGDVRKVVAPEVEILGNAHDGSILLKGVLAASGGIQGDKRRRTLRMTLSRNCIV